MTDITSASLQGAAKGESVAFGSIFLISFVVFLAIALIAQVVTLNWRLWLPGAEGEKSLVSGVRASVYTFMSYLN